MRKAAEYGIQVVIDPHQDVWSRFSGGDGAPAWTFEVAGLDVTKFSVTGAALVHQTYDGDKAEFPRMCWPTNMHKLACGTMFTLFFGGAKFAPKLTVNGESVQSYLQDSSLELDLELESGWYGACAFAPRRGLGKQRHVETCFRWAQGNVASGAFRSKGVSGGEGVVDVLTQSAPAVVNVITAERGAKQQRP